MSWRTVRVEGIGFGGSSGGGMGASDVAKLER